MKLIPALLHTVSRAAHSLPFLYILGVSIYLLNICGRLLAIRLSAWTAVDLVTISCCLVLRLWLLRCLSLRHGEFSSRFLKKPIICTTCLILVFINWLSSVAME